jgi:excisionase family DNA binding protein
LILPAMSDEAAVDLLSVEGVAQLTGLSVSAIRGRIERGSIPARRHGGKVRVPLADLYRAGLVGARGSLEVADLLDRLERQAEEIGRLRERLGQLEARG